MHNPKTAVLILLAIGLVLVGIAHAQGSQAGGAVSVPTAPITYNMTWQINTECPLCQSLGIYPWAQTVNSYSWAAGRQFTLVIRDLNQVTSLTNVIVNSTANSTGFVTFQVQASPANINVYTTWDAALLVNWHGYYFLLYEVPNFNGTFADLMGNLTGHYYTVLPNATVRNYYYDYSYTAPHGNATGAFPTYGNIQSYMLNNSWGQILTIEGHANFANFTSAVLHQFYLGVGTAGQSYNLTLVETLSIGGSTVNTWTYKPLSSPTMPYGPVFGPITYLGTYVPSLGSAGQTVGSQLSPSSVSYMFQVVMSIYNQQTGTYVQQTLITSTNGIYTTSVSTPMPYKTYVIETLNYTSGVYTATPSSVNATCQRLVIWPLPLSTLTVGMLFDIKGNPILSPEYFVFKVQENIGGYPLTISQQYGGWKTDITDFRFGFLHTLCGGTVSSFSDIANCFNTMTRAKLVNAVYQIYSHPTLAWISGTLTLTNNEASLSSLNLSPRLIVEYSYQATQYTSAQPQPTSGYVLTNNKASLSSLNLSPRLIVEYSYQATQYTSAQPQPTSGYVQAVVLQAPLNASAPINANANLTVSILPVQIPLWWRNNVTLPNGQPFNSLALAQGLTFVFKGTTAYLTETGQYAVVADPWSSSMSGTNQLNTLYLWALPPYEYVPITPGTYMDLLTLFNASGYLPLPPLNAVLANLTSGTQLAYGFRYLNWSNAVGLSSFFSQYGLSVGATQYTYNFRIYAGSVLVGTANVIATYPQVYANGTMVETQSNVASALQAQYGPAVYDDAYTVQAIYYNATAGVYGLQAQKLSFYNLEHAINVAINLKTMNMLFRDFCGNVPSVLLWLTER